MRTRFRDSIRLRLIVLITVTVLPGLALMVYSAWEQRTKAATDAQENAMRLVHGVSAKHQELIESSRQLLVTLSKLLQVQNPNPAACGKLVGEILKEHPVYGNIGVVDMNGEVFCSAVPLKQSVNVADRLYFKKAIKNKGFALGEYQIGRVTGKPSLAAGYPLVDSKGDISAVVFAAVELDWLNRYLVRGVMPPDSDLTVVDRSATVLTRYPDPIKWIGQSVADAAITKHVFSQGEGRAEDVGPDGVQRLYAFTTVYGIPGEPLIKMWASIPKQVVFAEVNRAFARNVTVLFLVTALIIATSWVVSDRSILRPLNALMEAAEQLGSGNFSVRAALGSLKGELGQLGARFNDMAESLQRRYRELKTLRAIDLGILSTLDLRSTLDILLEKIDEHLPYPAVTVRIFNKETYQLELKAWRNVDIEQLLKNASTVTRSLPHLVFESSKPISITDIASYGKSDEELLIPQGYKSYLGVPLGAKGELIGVLSFYTKEQHEFTEEEIDFLTTVAGQGSIAIDNSLLYERTKQQAAELAVSSRIKSEFLSIVSHELRTPVNVISGYSNLVYEGMFGDVNPDQKKALQTIRKHTDELLTLIESMIEATKLHAGDIKVMFGVFRMADIIEHLKARFDRPVENDVALQWDFPPDLPAFRTDGNKVLLILKNLIENALKFTSTGAVTVSARHDSVTSSMKVMVQDTGIGISEEMQDGIFERFRQGDSSDTRTYGGVGLGLYIVKRFTELLGGTIEVESRIGCGSKFTVTLPANATAIVEKDASDLTKDGILEMYEARRQDTL